MTNHPTYEILAKEIVYIIDNPNFAQPVSEFLNATGYKLDHSLNDPSTGFQAFGFTSVSNNSPVLVFRGTNEALDDVANSDSNGIGFGQFVANRDAIAVWLTRTAQTTQKKPDIIGHSLGGAIAQVTATELIDLIGEVVTFSSPGTSRAIADQFLQKGGENKAVTHYIVDGDVVSLAGEAFIAGTAMLLSFTNPEINPLYNLDKHQKIGRLLSTSPPGFTQTEISVRTLSHPAFTYFNSDYLEFLVAYSAINPSVAESLTSRGKVEALRKSGFSFQKFIIDVLERLALDQDNWLVGDAQNNTANGAAGNDTLIGKGGNDQLNGGAGKDKLIGVDLSDDCPGFQELDTLTGGDAADVFMLGNKKHTFYASGNQKALDYALITDFEAGDLIELPGKPTDYELKQAPHGLPEGIAIYLKAQDELIGIVQGKTDLVLDRQSFCFV
ncbi:Mbeg1-like protein [Phormidesmis sp. 146-12]